MHYVVGEVGFIFLSSHYVYKHYVIMFLGEMVLIFILHITFMCIVFWERWLLFLLFTSCLCVLCFLVSTLEISYTSGSSIRPLTIASTFVVFTLCSCLCVGYITTHLKPFAHSILRTFHVWLQNSNNLDLWASHLFQVWSFKDLVFTHFGIHLIFPRIHSSTLNLLQFFFLCHLFISIAFIFYFVRTIHCSQPSMHL